jgi:N-acetylneuraminic acid mutarotase
LEKGTGKFLTSVIVLLLAFSVIGIPFGVEEVNAEEHSSWTTLAPLPTPLYSTVGAAVVDGKIYFIGSHAYVQYDPETNNWTEIAPMPIYSSWGTVVACQNKIYVVGGNASKPTQVYDPATDTWENRTSIPTTRNLEHAVVVYGKIYVIGGLINAPLGVIITSSANDVYDPETDSWSQMEPIPVPVMGYASAVLDDKIYVISGGYEGGPGYNPANLVQIFDPATNQSTNGTSIPIAVVDAGACVTTGASAPKRIYVLGGTTNYGFHGGGGRDFNQVYDPETDTWSNGTAMPTPRKDLGVTVVNDEVYAIGSYYGDIPLATNEKYTPQADPIPEFPSWTILPLILTATAFLVIVKRKLHKVKVV